MKSAFGVIHKKIPPKMGLKGLNHKGGFKKNPVNTDANAAKQYTLDAKNNASRGQMLMNHARNSVPAPGKPMDGGNKWHTQQQANMLKQKAS